MFVDEYYLEAERQIQVSRQQASDFAKNIADDFNPIHDVEAKRFCVPGDLLFAIMLAKYGLSHKMSFTFSGMVTDDVSLLVPDVNDGHISIASEAGKEYLTVDRSSNVSVDQELINRFIRSYVEFSGHNFPHILVPLMAEQDVMINPDRPLVMYQGMSFELDRLNLVDPKLELVCANLEVVKKRGNVLLEFCLREAGKVVGRGEKMMVLSGLRPFEQDKIDQLVNDYVLRK
jgi:hypothetical protein